MLLAVRAWPWVLGLLALFPVLAPGFVPSYDMVFVPDLAMRPDFLGLGSALPRAVPSDAVVAVLDEVVPGMVLQKIVLVGGLVLAGAGARRLVPEDQPVAQLAATTLYVWNPYVAERLGLGHWTVLLAYAALPWIVDAARRLRRGEPALAALVLWLALSAISPSGGVCGAVAALVLVAGFRGAALRRTLLVAAAALAVNLPWLVAGLLHAGAARTDPDGVTAFAAQAEGLLPLPLTLLGLGGIWNSEVVPVSRTGWAAVVQLLVLLVVAIAGLRAWRRWLPRRDVAGLVVLAVTGLVVAGAAAAAPDLLARVVAEVPGAGLFRDGSRFLMLLAPLEASLFGLGAAAVLARVRERVPAVVVASGVVLAPLALMPDLGAGLAGALRPVAYPDEYADARAALEAEASGTPGRVLVLPLSSYRLPAWNDGRRTLDPLGRYLTPDYLAGDDLYVSGVRVAGEDPRAARVGRLLSADPAAAELVPALREEGIRWIVQDEAARRAPGERGAVVPASFGEDVEADGDPVRVIWAGPTLTVWDLGGPVAEDHRSTAELWLVGGAWVAAVGTAAAALVRVARARARRPT